MTQRVRLSPQRGTWEFNRGDPVIMTDAWRRNPVRGVVVEATQAGGLKMDCPRGLRYYAPPDSDRVWPFDLFHPDAPHVAPVERQATRRRRY